MLSAVALPLLVLVIALALQQFHGQRRALLDELAGRARAERIALEPVLRAAMDHVRGLREYAEDRLAGRLPQRESPLRRELGARAHGNGIVGVHLDELANTPIAVRIGNVLGDQPLLERSPEAMFELDQALDLFAPMRLAHLAAPQLRWSYYLSAQGDFMTMFPFAPGSEFVALGSYGSMAELIAGWLGYEVFQAGTPARDPERQPYWTPVYANAGGAGLMVSHAAPVYAGERFMGVVGTDILLSHLRGLLRQVAWPVGEILIVSDTGELLAASGETAPTAPASAKSVLPAALAELPLADLLRGRNGFHDLAGFSVLAEPLQGTPFTMLYLVPAPDLTSLILPRFKPYAIILVGLMLALLAAHLLLQGRFVRPALRLVRHIKNESDGQPGLARVVPALWRPWFDAVSEAFATGRDYQSRLEASEGRLRAAAESIPDGLAIFDAEDRLVFFNSHYPDQLTDNLRATLEPGKRWADWGREAARLGPVYHPEMGPDYLERRIADRSLATVDREHRLIDGRWVRVRERRMPDGGRVLLSTDTTAERRDRQERALIAAAMAQVGDSIEITDPDYRLLYVNPAFTALTGFTAEEALGRTPGDLMRSDEHPPEFYQEIDRTIRAGRIWQGRIVGRHKLGRLIHQDVTISPVMDETGRLVNFVAAKRDVSETIRAEAALRASEARFLAAAESIPDGLAILDFEDRFVFYNSRHPEMLPPALREGLQLGIRFRDWVREGLARGPVYHPDMGPDYGERRLASRSPSLTEREHKHIDGRWVRIREAPMPDGGRVLLTTDITDRREAEARFLAAAESIPDGLAILDSEDRFVFYNSRYPSHLPANLRQVLRVGQRFEDWIRAGAALGPIYHPDMGDDFVDRRLALRVKDEHEHEHKLIDSRWCRVRESRMSDGGRVLLASNVTERRRRQQQLSLLAMAVDQVGDAVEIADARGCCTYVNPAFVRLTGFTPDEVMGRRIRDVLRSGRHDAEFYDGIDRCLEQGRNWQGRIVNRRKDGELVSQDTTISPLRDRSGNITHYVAVKRDVTEQEKAEAAIRASEARYRAVVDTQNEFIARIAPDGRLSFVNDAYCRYYGQSRETLLGRVFNDFTGTLPEDRERDATHLGSLTPSNPSRTIELRRRAPDGDVRWVQWVDTAIFDSDGNMVEIQSVGRDVTDQRNSELALRTSEASYRALVETQTEFVLRQRPDGSLTFVNEAYCRYVGRSRQQMLEGSWNDLDMIATEDRERYERHLHALTPDRPTASIEIRAILPDGAERWELWVDTGIFNAEGKLAEIQSVGRDITERKQAEFALRESEARYRALVETQTEFVLRQLPEGQLTFVNEAYCRYVGKPREELLGPDFNGLDMMVPEDRPRFDAHLRRLTPDQPTAVMETRAILPDGSLRWERWVDTGIFDAEGRLVELQSTGRDITEQKNSEMALRASEARYRAVVEGQTEFILRLDPDGFLTFVNDAYCRYRGIPREAMLNRFNDVVHYPPEQQARIRAAWATLTPDVPTVTYELVKLHPDGSQGWEEWTDTAVFRPDGRVVEYQAIGRNITERKLAEQSLRDSEARYRALVETQSEFIIRRQPEGRLTFVNEAFCRYTGRTREEMLAPDWNDYDLIAPEDRERHDRFIASLTPARPSGTIELRAILPNGRQRIEQWSSVGVFDAEGRLVEIQAVGRDVTERREAEKALLESESRFRLIAESVPLPIAITAMDRYCVLFVNAKGREVFGIESGITDRARIEGIWVDPAARARIARHIVEDGSAEHAEVRMRRAEGSEFDAIMSARPLNYGGESAVLGVITDITERRRIEEALRESEARLAALMDNAPLVVHLKDRTGRYLLANPESAKIFGREPVSVIGRTVHEIFPPDEARTMERHHQEVLATGRTHFHEEYQSSLDAYRWSMVIRFPIRDAQGEIAVVGCFALDITRSKLAEAEVKASAERFRTIADIHPTPMVITRTRDREVLFANRACYDVFKVPADEFARIDRSRLYGNAEDRERLYDDIAQDGRIEGREIVMRTAAGDEFPVMLTARSMMYEGNPACVMSYLDLSALKRAEAALRASEQRFRSIAEAHPMPLVIVRKQDGRLLFANQPFGELFGMSLEQLELLTPEQFYADATARERFLAAMQADGMVEGLEQTLRRMDGSTFPAATTSRLIEYEGQPAFVTSVVDLTERRAAEAEIQRQRESLHQSEKLAALGALLAGVAHELNNPLSVVVGYSSMLQELAQDEASRQRAARVHGAAERCARIVKTFLAMARSRPPQYGPARLGEIVENALELAGYGLRTADIEIVREFDPDLPAVWGDSDQLHQVLTNLIVNAQQALLQAPLPRRLHLRLRAKDGHAVIEIEDNGPGIPDAVRQRIFEPFFTTKPQGVGTGVGLSVCLAIVTAHEGRINLWSEPGRGTRFSVVLPLPTAVPVDASVAIPEAAGPARGRVLVVDDEAEIAELVAEHLRRDGLTVEVVASGSQALLRLQSEQFDVVVSDLRMPDLDGPALVAALRQRHPELARRVVLITGDALGAEFNETIRDAELPVFEKPLDIAALRGEVRRLLEAA
jgi:PAS domain S-box-containing protein